MNFLRKLRISGQICQRKNQILSVQCMSTENVQNNHQFSNPATENVQNNNQSTSGDEEKQYLDDIKKKILTASLEFVKENGWTRETMGKGAMAVGYASTVQSIFPHGPAHLVNFFTTECNSQLADKMEKEVMELPHGVVNPIKFIENSIVSRIEMLEPYKHNWSNALATVVNSKMVIDQAAALMTLADDICYFAGDRSVNSTWYARRAGVGAIYQAGELHWLGGGKQTRDFIEAQLLIASNVEAVPKNLSAILTIVRNIVPVSFNR